MCLHFISVLASVHGARFDLGIERGLAGHVQNSFNALALRSAARGLPTLKVFTYNLCWGCMEGSRKDRTAMAMSLGKSCTAYTDLPGPSGPNGNGINVTFCAKNMGRAIAKYHQAIGGYDLMGFQEASNFDSLGLRAAGVNMVKVEFGVQVPMLHSRGIHKGKNKNAWVVTLYNHARLGACNKAIGGALKADRGRPWQALIFDTARLIFINVHNVQPGRLAFVLGSRGPKSSWNGFLKEVEQVLVPYFRALKGRKDYRVIVTGDFNDLGGQLPGSINVPWQKLAGKLRIRSPLAATCCSARMFFSGSKPGDYIFDSAAEAVNRVPPAYDEDVPQSDHKPVEAILGAGSEKFKAPPPAQVISQDPNRVQNSARGHMPHQENRIQYQKAERFQPQDHEHPKTYSIRELQQLQKLRRKRRGRGNRRSKKQPPISYQSNEGRSNDDSIRRPVELPYQQEQRRFAYAPGEKERGKLEFGRLDKIKDRHKLSL